MFWQAFRIINSSAKCSSASHEEISMFNMLSLASPSRQLEAAREVLSHLAELLDAKFSIELWDGTRIPLGREVKPHLAVAIRGPGVIGSLLRWPTLDNLVRHYATGQIEVQGGDLIAFFEAARVERSRSRLGQLRTGTLLKSALPFLLAPAEKVNLQHAFAGAQVGRSTSSRNNRDYIQFHYALGTEFYELLLDPERKHSRPYC